MSDHGGRIIIVKKKKKAHHAHHGGSWKVAYADFVTAMMAFFLVMWIMGMDQGVKDMVQGYFQNPVGFKRAFSGGRNPMSAGNFIVNLADNQSIILNRQQQERQFQEVIEEIERRIEESGLLDHADANVEMVITQDGLRIEFMETGQGATFFEKSSADLTPALRQVLQVVGSQLGRVPGDVILEGHTDALAFPGVEYSNWELSVDRANAARRVLVRNGLPIQRLMEVRGYADRQLKVEDAPRDPRNRRISLLMPFLEIPLDSLKIPGVTPDQLGAELRTSEPIPDTSGEGD